MTSSTVPSVAVDTPPPMRGAGVLASLERVPVAWGLALCAALLMLASPYRGIRHDGLLYVGQALMHVDPTWLANDFFFRYGSQDQFTLFTPVLGGLIGAFGIGTPVVLLLVAGRVLSLGAVWLLTAGWPASRRWLAVLAYAGLTHHFGAARTFSLLEPFLTARTFAEPFALLGLAALVRGRSAWAGAALLVALLCHPLVALPALVVAWLYLAAADRRWAFAALILLPVLGLSAAGVQPFARLLQVYDAQWLSIVELSNADIFLREWRLNDWVMLAGNVLFLGYAIRGRKDALARLGRATLAGAALLLAVSFVGADLLHDQLVAQLQFWRVLWLVHLGFVLWLPITVLELWARGGLARQAALATFFVAPAITASFPNGWALLLWTVGLLVLDARGIVLPARTLRLVLFATAAIGVCTAGMLVWNELYQVRMRVQGTALAHPASLPFTLAIATVPACALLLSAAAAEGGRRLVARAAIVAILLAAAWQYDQRSAFTRTVETAAPGAHPFAALIPKGAQVFWEDMAVEPSWFMLHRPSYTGYAQYAGLLFNRRTALAGMARWPFMAALIGRQESCRFLEGMLSRAYRFEDCEIPEDLFFAVCKMPQEHADFAVTHLKYSRPALATWRFVPDDGEPPVTYYLHDCRNAR